MLCYQHVFEISRAITLAEKGQEETADGMQKLASCLSSMKIFMIQVQLEVQDKLTHTF